MYMIWSTKNKPFRDCSLWYPRLLRDWLSDWGLSGKRYFEQPPYIYICIIIFILNTYIYIPSGPQVSARGGVGWGMLTSSSWYVDGWGGVGHVNVMFMVRWWVGWGGVGHVNVMFMLHVNVDRWGGVGHVTSSSWYVDGGVGWGMLTSSSWYVDGWGGVGHVNVMFMVRWWVGWGGVGHVNVMFMLRG